MAELNVTDSSSRAPSERSLLASATRGWKGLFSRESQLRKKSVMQGMHHILDKSVVKIRSLGPGAPSTDYFPFYGMDFDVPLSEAPKTDCEIAPKATAKIHAGKHDSKNGDSIYDIAIALQYGQGTGSTQLLKFLSEHVKIIHDPPYKNWRCILTAGNTSAFDIILRMFTKPGDYLLVEEYTYPTVYETALPMGLRFSGIRMDDFGMIPAHLDEVLSNWSEDAEKGKKPRLLYVIPCGQNPSGATQPTERRREIYRIAQEHDLLILEDDPYYFIQFPPYTSPTSEEKQDTDLLSVSQNFAEVIDRPLLPSYLSLDNDGRVLRMDSFSKIIAPGARMGWVTAPEQIVERFVRAHEVSVQNPSGFSQLAIFKLLHDYWGHSGFKRWLAHLQIEYGKRRNMMVDLCEWYLPHEITYWTPPSAGFFIWISVDWKQHPYASTKSPREVEQEIYDSAISHGTLVIPGSAFLPEDKEGRMDKVFFRMTYASVPPGTMQEAIRGLGDALREVFRL
ncbi:PLP-dependent transferase [Aspergillus alliaceus]|uniref:PLP-dependent transferase n=1 Tax=Petromyces alliaceus TaxID=209559 RepID=A0A5N7BT93_PETAA|nr:PLP-dependent transferase [Aspergillus alliaceus]